MATQITTNTQILDNQIGFNSISLTNFDSDQASLLNGVVEVSGSFYKFVNESITDSATAGKCYLEIVATVGTASARFTSTIGTWDDTKNGFYNGNNRQIGDASKIITIGNKKIYKNQFEKYSFSDSFFESTSLKKAATLSGVQSSNLHSVAASNSWESITYGNGLFVAVSDTGTGNRVMTSPDGITWTSRTSASNNSWESIIYGNGLFVAVSSSGTGNRVMTSPDGITWTIRTSAADNSWESITYGNGLFVAVSSNGSSDRVMTSPDGITWTSRTSTADNLWTSITYGSGLFVAVSSSAASNNIMTSPDGINWTGITSSVQNLRDITFGSGLFVACANNTGDNIITSIDGIIWNSYSSNLAIDNISNANGAFVGIDESTGQISASGDGTVWSEISTPSSSMSAITFNDGIFVSVGNTSSALVTQKGY